LTDTTMKIARRALALGALAGLLALGTSCEVTDTQENAAFTRFEFYNTTGASKQAADATKQKMREVTIKVIDDAKLTVDIALSRLTFVDVADALIRAQARGVRVRVVSDETARGDVGMQKLESNGIAVAYGDGELSYLPDPTLGTILAQCYNEQDFIQCERSSGAPNGVMTRPDAFNLMSHNFVVADAQVVVNFSSPLDNDTAYMFGWESSSPRMAEGFVREFQQMYGGVFATTLDLFNGPVKSVNQGPIYDTAMPGADHGSTRRLQPGFLSDEGLVTIKFNPQERLVKNIIDEVYRARGSVYLMTDELINSFAIDALEAKKADGFEVRVIVRRGSIIPERARALGVREAPAEFTYLPTVLVTNDLLRGGKKNAGTWPIVAQVMTHAMWRDFPFELVSPIEAQVDTNGDLVRIYRSDVFADGSLWSSSDFIGVEYGQGARYAERMARVWNEIWDNATPAQ
jgi:hypothetical protein